MGLGSSRWQRAGAPFLLAGVLLIGCGEPAPEPSSDALQVRLEAVDQVLAPIGTLPPGMHLRVVNRETPRYSDSWVALYGDPSLADPLTGAIVHVVYVSGSETGAGWRAGSGGGSTWLSRPLPDDDQEVDSVVVGGRGVGRDELDQMLDRVVLGDPVRPDTELRPAHLGEGDTRGDLALLAEGELPLENAFWAYSGVLGGGPALLWTDPKLERQLRVATVAQDEAALMLIRSIIDSPRTVERSGKRVPLGSPLTIPPASAAPSLLAVWEEDGMLVVVQSLGLAEDEVEQVIGDLEVTGDQDWPRLVDEAELAPPPADRGTVVVSGHADGVRWWIADVPGPYPQYDVWLEAVDGRTFGQGGIGGCNGSSATLATLEPLEDPVATGSVAAGVAPGGTTRVRLETDEGAIDASTTALSSGRTLWWTWSKETPVVTAINVFDSSGALSEQLDVPALGGLVPGSAFCAPASPAP